MIKLKTIPAPLKKSYDKHLEAEKIQSTRMYAILGVSLFFFSSFLDDRAIPSVLHEVTLFRSMMIGMFGSVFVSTFYPIFIKYCNIIQHMCCLAPAIAISYILSISSPSDSGHYIYFGFLILLVMILFSWTHIKIWQILVNATCIIGYYSLTSYLSADGGANASVNELLVSIFVMLGALLAGFFGRLINENQYRKNFLYSNRLKELAEKQYFFANHDELTGLANRRLAQKIFQEDLEESKQNGYKYILMLLDLNHFKRVNDQLGHQKGDELLQIVASRIHNCIRQEDHVFRLGGDEFAISIVLKNKSTDFINTMHHKLQSHITKPVRLNDTNVSVGISIGAACYPDDLDSIRLLLNLADERMYLDKNEQKRKNLKVSDLIS